MMGNILHHIWEKVRRYFKGNDMTIKEFDEICENFDEIFMCDQSGKLIKDDQKKLKLINDGF